MLATIHLIYAKILNLDQNYLEDPNEQVFVALRIWTTHFLSSTGAPNTAWFVAGNSFLLENILGGII